MELRRRDTVSGNVDAYVLLIAISAVFHLAPPRLEIIYVDAVGVSYLLVMYAGYKYGRYWGLLAGLVSVGFWLLFTLLSAVDLSVGDVLFGAYLRGEHFPDYPSLEDFTVFHFSIQSLLLFSLLGYLSGYVCDKAEQWLEERGLTLSELLPRVESNFILGVGGWFERISKALFLLQLNPEDKDGAIKKRLRKIFVLVVTIPLVTLFVALSMQWSLSFERFSVNLVPAFFSPVLALWLSHRLGQRIGVWLSLSLLFTPLVYLYVEESGLSSELMVRGNGVPLSVVVALSAAAWLIGTISRQLENDSLREKLALKRIRDVSEPGVYVTNLALMFVFSLGFRYQGEEFAVKYYPSLALLAYVAWLSFQKSRYSVSNSILVVLGLLSLFRMQMPFGDGRWQMILGGLSIPEVVFISLVPYALSYAKIGSLKAARMLYAGLLGSLLLTYLVFSYRDGGVLPDVFVSVSYQRTVMMILSLVLMLALTEALARLTWVRMRRLA